MNEKWHVSIIYFAAITVTLAVAGAFFWLGQYFHPALVSFLEQYLIPKTASELRFHRIAAGVLVAIILAVVWWLYSGEKRKSS